MCAEHQGGRSQLRLFGLEFPGLSSQCPGQCPTLSKRLSSLLSPQYSDSLGMS